jgi:hypothetical protein
VNALDNAAGNLQFFVAKSSVVEDVSNRALPRLYVFPYSVHSSQHDSWIASRVTWKFVAAITIRI